MEILIEIFGEIILELIVHGLGFIIGKFANFVDTNSKVKKILKYTITFLFFGLSLILLIMSIIYRKKILIIVTLVYMLISLLLNISVFTNSNFNTESVYIKRIIYWFKKLVLYSYFILIIIFSSIEDLNKKSRVTVIVSAVIAMIIYFSIDMFKLSKYCAVKEAEKVEKLRNKLKDNNNDEEEDFFK